MVIELRLVRLELSCFEHFRVGASSNWLIRERFVRSTGRCRRYRRHSRHRRCRRCRRSRRHRRCRCCRRYRRHRRCRRCRRHSRHSPQSSVETDVPLLLLGPEAQEASTPFFGN